MKDGVDIAKQMKKRFEVDDWNTGIKSADGVSGAIDLGGREGQAKDKEARSLSFYKLGV